MNGKKLSKKWLYTFIGIAFVALATCTAALYYNCLLYTSSTFKRLDLSTRIPSIYKEKEMQIRSLLLQSLERGKVEFNIFVEYIGKDTPTQINLAAVENY